MFADALSRAEREQDEFYAVDAAHMLGIAAPPPERMKWNLKALALAEAATDTRARDWRASLYNNIGWTYFDAGDAKTALDFWQKALALRAAMGDAARTRVAKWTVARGYRAVGRLDDAEALQKELVAEFDRDRGNRRLRVRGARGDRASRAPTSKRRNPGRTRRMRR